MSPADPTEPIVPSSSAINTGPLPMPAEGSAPTSLELDASDTPTTQEYAQPTPEQLPEYLRPPKPSLATRLTKGKRLYALAGTALVIIAGITAFGIYRHPSTKVAHNDTQQQAAAPLVPINQQTLTVNTQLKVASDTNLLGKLAVTGPTKLQGDVTASGNFTISGRSVLTGTLTGIQAHFTGPVDASDIATLTITATGVMHAGSVDTGQLNAQSVSLGNLSVTGDSSLGGGLNVGKDATVTGALSAHGMVINGDGAFSGTLRVGASTNVGGTLTVAGTVIAPLLQGRFEGTFVGDGSGLTNLDATNCVNCVMLQSGTPSAQTGSIAIAGSLTAGDATVAGALSAGDTTINGALSAGNTAIAGTLTAGETTIVGAVNTRGVHIAPVADATDTFSVQNASGETIMAISTLDKHITVENLRPTQAGEIINVPGTPDRTVSSLSLVTLDADTSAGYNSTDMALGPDGYARVAYDYGTGLKILRCTDVDCSSPVVASIASDGSGGNYNFARIKVGADGFVRVAYNGGDGLHVVHCKDLDCATYTNNLVDGSGGYNAGSYGVSMDIDATGLVRIAYANDPGTGWGTYYAACNDQDCSSTSVTYIDTNIWGYQAVGMKLGADGFARIDYEDTASAFKLARCTDTSCSSPVITVVNDGTDGSQPGYYGNIVTFGQDGMPRLAYESNIPKIHYVICQDADCTQKSDTVVDNATDIGQNFGMVMGADGFARILYPEQSTSYLKMMRCTDDACSSPVASIVDSTGSSGYNGLGVALAADGFLRAAFKGSSAGDIVYAHLTGDDVTSTLIPGQPAYTVVTNGTDIGASDARFGQIYAQGVNLQTVSGVTALTVNQDGSSGSGTIASFTVNGVERLGISSGGTLRLVSDGTGPLITASDVNGKQHLMVDANGNLSVGDNLSLIQTAANFNLVASATGTSDLMHAYDSTGNVVFNITKDGSIKAGSSAYCASCAPKSIINALSADTAYGTMHITINGHYAYLASAGDHTLTSVTGHALTVFDITDPVKPVLTDRQAAGLSSLGNFVINGNYGYLSIEDPINAIQTYDLSNPAHPRLVNSLTPSPDSDQFDMAVSGSYLYVAARTGLGIYSLSNPAAPTRVTVLSLGSSTYGNANIVIIGNTAFVRDYYDGQLFSVDISNPTTPKLIGTLSLTLYEDGMSSNMVAQGNTIYLSCGLSLYCSGNTSGSSNSSVAVVNVSDPANMSVAGYADLNYPSPSTATRLYFSISGSYMYVSSGKQISVLDISNPLSPIMKDSYTGTASVNAIQPIGHYLYATSIDTNYLNIMSQDGSSTFQGVQATTLQVTAGASVGGSLQIGGPTSFSSTASVDHGADLIVSGIPTPVPSSQYSQYWGGSLSGSSTAKYYYKISALTARGTESMPTSEYAVPGTSFGPIGTWAGYALSAGTSVAGSLTGTFQYQYTYVTANGESSANGTSNQVTAASQQVQVSGFHTNFAGDSSVTQIKIYRCTMPACSSYNYVGSVTYPHDGSTVTFTDNNTSPSTVIPTTNTARTDTNIQIFTMPSDPSIAGYRLYRTTTSGTNYTYKDFPMITTSSTMTISDDGSAFPNTGNPPTTSAGRLGVGTATPRAKLDVVGDMILQSDTNKTNAFQVQNAAGNVLFDADTANQRLGVGTAAPQATLQVSAVGTGGSLFKVTDTTPTAQDVLDIADTGIVTFRNQTDSTSAFRVQNAAGATVFNVNTTNLRIEVASGSDVKLLGAGNVRNALIKDYTCTATEAVNDIVVITGVATVGRTTTAGNNRVAGVVVAKPVATTCTIAFSGSVQVNFGTNAAPTTVGDPVTTSALAGMAQTTTTPAAGSVLGISTSIKDASNLVWVLIKGN